MASLSQETAPPAVSQGTRIGGYEIGRRLGIGSMGAVYAGVRVADGKPVAVKLLAADLAEKPSARARFLNEAKLTARVSHPHVVAVIDSGEESERVYLVMDLLEGEDLARRLRRSGPMPVGEVIDVLDPICDAVGSANRAGVTHRDLKPANIFLAVREERIFPMLLDFGVATVEDGTGEVDAPGPRTWNGVGTPMYLAPELVADPRAAGPASDQYALGTILFEALTGEPPYAADDLQQLLRTIASGRPPSVRGRRPEVSAELDAVVLRAMNAAPEQRFRSIEDLRRALRPFAGLPATDERPRRHRAPSSPAMALEAATPSPFVRTLVPEHQAESRPWFVAPDSDEISEEIQPSGESDSLAGSPMGPEVGGRWVEDEDRGDKHERGAVEEVVHTVESAGSRVENVGPAIEDHSPDEDPLAPPARVLVAAHRQLVSAFAQHRRLVAAFGIALFGVALLALIHPGRSVSRSDSVRPGAAPAPAKTELAPATLPPAVTAQKPEPVPARLIAPASPHQASATVEPGQVAPARRPVAAPIPTRTDAAQHRPTVAEHDARPTPPRAESPNSKVSAPTPAATSHLQHEPPVRMHNGVPLLD